MREIVKVVVREIARGKVVVGIPSLNRLGIIRRKDLSWNKSSSFIPKFPKVGETLNACVIYDPGEPKEVILSVRELTDPWSEYSSDFHKDLTVRGEVVTVRHFAAFVQIKPGIDAILYPSGLPIRSDEKIERYLSVGDQVEAIITEFDINHGRIEISILKYLEIIAENAIDIRNILVEDFSPPLLTSEENGSQKLVTRSRDHEHAKDILYVIIADDDIQALSDISSHFSHTFSFNWDVCESYESLTNTLFDNEQPCDLLLIDRHFGNKDGVEVALEIQGNFPDIDIIIISNNPMQEIIGFKLIHKRPEQIVEELSRSYNLEFYDDHSYAVAMSDTDHSMFIKQLGMMAYDRHSLIDMLKSTLGEIRSQLSSAYAMIIEVDPLRQKCWLSATQPSLPQKLENHYLEDGLFFSPIREVLIENDTLYEFTVDKKSGRFKNFFQLLDYTAWIGAPLNTADIRYQYVLILLFDKTLTPDSRRKQYIQSATKQLEIDLERGLFFKYMERYERRYSQGVLIGTLLHDVKTKIDALNPQIEKLSTSVNSNELSNSRMADMFTQQQLANITESWTDLKELTESYGRLVGEELRPVNVNDVIRGVFVQLRKYASERGITSANFKVNYSPEVLEIWGVDTSLNQIVLNVVLNAIQHIELHQKRLNKVNTVNSLGGKDIWITTVLAKKNTHYPIRIIVYDMGPGINRYRWDEIFRLDTSSRSTGHGLGLFISRTLAKKLGGRIYLSDSLMFIGSKFVIEIPALERLD